MTVPWRRNPWVNVLRQAVIDAAMELFRKRYMKNEDKPLILCAMVNDPVFEEMGIKPIAGSVEEPCCKCGEALYVGPAGQKLIMDGEADGVICDDCFDKLEE